MQNYTFKPAKRSPARRICHLLCLALLLSLAFSAGRYVVRHWQRVMTAETQFENLLYVKEYPNGQLREGLLFDELVVEKSLRRLTAYTDGLPMRVYFVALGTNPMGHKEYEGDRKTPEGKYTIYGKNPNSDYYKNLGISYPNAADREHAKVLGLPPGGDVKIHGLKPNASYLGTSHRMTDWTHGCIAVTNAKMDELYARTPVGTPIKILP